MHFEPPSAYLVQALAATIAGNEADAVLTNDGRFLCGHRAHDENGALGETCCPSGSPRPQMPTGFRFRQNAGLPYYYIHFPSKVCTFFGRTKECCIQWDYMSTITVGNENINDVYHKAGHKSVSR